jgi:hypothetical protein
MGELDLCRSFLKLDQRNFHCWNYRRNVVDLLIELSSQPKQQIIERELRFSIDKIHENFSNYSAFHHRSIYIRSLSVSFSALFPEELSLVLNAVFTEPDDQSAWWYFQFLLDWAKTESAKAERGSCEWLWTLLLHALGQLTVSEGVVLDTPYSWFFLTHTPIFISPSLSLSLSLNLCLSVW